MSVPSSTVEQDHRLTADRLRPADGADALAGLGLDVDGVGGKAEKVGERAADVRLDRPQLRLLGEDNDVEVDHPPARLAQPPQRVPDKEARIRALVRRV